MRKLIAAIVVATCIAPARAADNRVSDGLRTELEPLTQAQEPEADRIGMTIVCEVGIPRPRALGLFDKMARAEAGTSYLESHNDPLERRVVVAEWARAQNLVCLD
jgi:hypothetical protein